MQGNDNSSRKMTVTIKSSWDALSWREYEQIEQILQTDIPYDYKAVHLVSVLTGMSVEDIEKLPINQFQKFIPAMEFLHTDPETHAHQFEYTINGREYDFKGKLTEISTAQYIDYRSYMDEEDRDIVKLMTVFLIPKGHEYNDGYDMQQVLNDIGDMCWLDIRAAAFFFRLQLSTFILTLKSSLVKSIKKTKTDRKTKKEQIKQIQESLDNTAYCLLFSESVNNQILASMM